MTAKAEILKFLPHGHTTFNVAWYGAARGEERTEYQGTYGHAVCVRQVGQHWYLIDSENGGPERLTGRGWAQLRGHMRLLAAYDSRDAEGHITGRYVRGMPPLPQWVKPEEVYRVPQCPAARACSVPPEMQPASPCPAVNAAPQDTSTQRQQDSAHLEVLEMPPLLTEQPGQPSPRPPTHVSPPMSATARDWRVAGTQGTDPGTQGTGPGTRNLPEIPGQHHAQGRRERTPGNVPPRADI